MWLGHLAVSWLLHHYLEVEPGPVLISGVFPDIVDKGLAQGLKLTPSGRMFAHTLLGLAGSTTAAGLIGGRSTALSWGVGYLGHLVADSAGFIPWFYPFVRYNFYGSKRGMTEAFRRALLKKNWLEWGVLLWAAWVVVVERRDPIQAVPDDTC
jgi:hypothetical protein